MKILSTLSRAVSRLNPLPLFKGAVTTVVVKPIIKPAENLVMNAIQSALWKSVSSLVKGLTAGLLVSLVALADKLPGVANPNDKVEVYIIAAVVAVLHAAISFVKRLATFAPSKAGA